MFLLINLVIALSWTTPPPNQRRFLKVDVTLPELPYDKQNKLRSLLNRFNLTSTNVNNYTVKPVLKFK